MSPATAIALGKLGGLGVLDLEGLWTRYEDPTRYYDRIAAAAAVIRNPFASASSAPRRISCSLTRASTLSGGTCVTSHFICT